MGQAVTHVPPFDFYRATDLDGAVEAVAEGAIAVHGGTELLPAMGMGLLAPEKVLSIRRVEELRACGLEDGYLIVGAGLTHLEVASNEHIRATTPLLAEVAEGVGNIRVRSTGTLGGNLAFAEPRSDVTTALVALDAEVRLVGPSGRRSVALTDFLVGPYEVDLRGGELIAAVALPRGASDFAVYKKIVLSERPVVGVALAHLVNRPRWRLVVGAVGLTPTIVDVGRLSEIDTDAIVASVDPTRDLNGSEEYKRHLTAVTIERCRAAAARLDGDELRT